jgi:hypothetical protein
MEHVCDSHKINMSLQHHVGPCFFHDSTIMIAEYLDVLQTFVFPQIVAEFDRLIFQKDGAPAHFGVLDESAGEGHYLATSPGLTPMDCFLWWVHQINRAQRKGRDSF